MGQAQKSLETLREALETSEPEGYLRTFVDLGRPMVALLYQALTFGLFQEYIAQLLALFPAEEAAIEASHGKPTFGSAQASDEALIVPLSQRE